MMIRQVIEMLQQEKYYNISQEVEVAKGKYQYIGTIKRFTRAFKRILYSNK